MAYPNIFWVHLNFQDESFPFQLKTPENIWLFIQSTPTMIFIVFQWITLIRAIYIFQDCCSSLQLSFANLPMFPFVLFSIGELMPVKYKPSFYSPVSNDKVPALHPTFHVI